LLIIAPVLLPKLSRIYSKDEDFKDDIKGQLNALWKIESFVCVLIPLILNVCWVDVVNLFTHNKYGEETKWVYLVLSMAIPMLFISNYLWTIAFAKGRLKLTFKISMVVTASNLILNIILIPRYHALGAAIASTSSLFIQLVLYCITVQEKQLMLALFDFIKTFIIAGFIIGCLMFSNLFWVVKCGIAVGVFVVLILAMGFYRDLKSVK
jgi:O-antigen/teichoic acid export membrane protein